MLPLKFPLLILILLPSALSGGSFSAPRDRLHWVDCDRAYWTGREGPQWVDVEPYNLVYWANSELHRPNSRNCYSDQSPSDRAFNAADCRTALDMLPEFSLELTGAEHPLFRLPDHARTPQYFLPAIFRAGHCFLAIIVCSGWLGNPPPPQKAASAMWRRVWPALREAGDWLLQDCFSGQADNNGRVFNVGRRIVAVEIEGRSWEFLINMRAPLGIPAENAPGWKQYGVGQHYHIYEKNAGA